MSKVYILSKSDYENTDIIAVYSGYHDAYAKADEMRTLGEVSDIEVVEVDEFELDMVTPGVCIK